MSKWKPLDSRPGNLPTHPDDKNQNMRKNQKNRNPKKQYQKQSKTKRAVRKPN